MVTPPSRRLAAIVLALPLLFGCALRPGFDFEVVSGPRDYTPPEHPGMQYFAGVCEAIKSRGAGEFLVALGDLDPPERVRATLDAVISPDYTWYPVVGYHDAVDEQARAYLRRANAGGTTLPGVVQSGPPAARETCYSFDRGNAHFIVLNHFYATDDEVAQEARISDALYQWLADDLDYNNRPFVFVFGYAPSVPAPDLTTGQLAPVETTLSDDQARNQRFWSLLREYGVVAYFCSGKGPEASVTRINGVWQIDVGHAAGRGVSTAPSTYVQARVTPGHVTCRLYRMDGGSGQYYLALEETLR